jgi:hypothetical protein
MALDIISKSPNDLLDYDFDFVRWMAENDRVTDAVANIKNISATVEKVTFDTDTVRVWIKGGILGEQGQMTVLITTDQGRKKEIAVQLRIRETF